MKNGIIALDPRVKLVLFFLTCIFERTKIRERLERTVKELKLADRFVFMENGRIRGSYTANQLLLFTAD